MATSVKAVNSDGGDQKRCGMEKVKLTKYEYRTLRVIAESSSSLASPQSPMLDALVNYSFVEKYDNGYIATDAGKQWLQAYDIRKSRRENTTRTA
jgi:hypothetical protein